MNDVILTVTDFVALTNQILETAFGSVVIAGELSNFRISKNKWVYFDLKDDLSSVRFFGTIFNLPGPLEDGMLLEVRGTPCLHPQFGFSITVQAIKPTGEGSIKKAAKLLENKLRKEGLFDDSRKRVLPYPPQTIGLITSIESAAYADFIKVLNARWRGISVRIIDVQVQGEPAIGQIVRAIGTFNQISKQPDVLVLIRGGGSLDDLQVFNTEQIVRAIAGSRIPTLVAIGHEIDLSLAEMAADRKASTPSNAAELIVPDRSMIKKLLSDRADNLSDAIRSRIFLERERSSSQLDNLNGNIENRLLRLQQDLVSRKDLVRALSPVTILERGYTIVRDSSGRVLRQGRVLKHDSLVNVQFIDATVKMQVKQGSTGE